MHTDDSVLTPVAPFDFSLSLRFLEGFSPAEGEQAIADGAVTKGLRVNGRTVVFRVTAGPAATVEKPALAWRLWSQDALDPVTREAAVARIARFLSIEDDLSSLERRSREDPVFAPVASRLRGLHQVRFLTPFENLCWAVMGQRAPIPLARKAKDAFVGRYGDALSVDDVRHVAFPAAADVAGVTADELMGVVGNRRRADYLANVIEAWQGLDEPWLYSAPVEDVQAWLRSIKGVGEWSTAFVLFRGLGRHAPMPMTPPALNAVRAAYGDITPQQAEALADSYAPWTGYWLMYLRAPGPGT
jgi:DNA-3-methyladenine glycosylase II